MRFLLAIVVAALGFVPAPSAAQAASDTPAIKSVAIGGGITLHYVDEGRGTPIVFVHGSISDGGYWADQVPEFAKHYRAIAYSRRYNFPNQNPAQRGYSAVVDADDLAAFIKKLALRKAVIVGHSYGAYAALFLAIRHPELVRALVLCEAPAIPLLADLPGNEAKTGAAALADIQRRMVAPMKAAFARGDRNGGVAAFIDYVFNNPHAWDHFDASDRKQTMRDAHEWDIMMTTGTLFPQINPAAIRGIRVPTLLMTGDRTYPFLTLIDNELARLLPNNQNLTINGAGHQMWYQQPQLCRDVVETFLRWSLARQLK